jgi:hypothetical protein
MALSPQVADLPELNQKTMHTSLHLRAVYALSAALSRKRSTAAEVLLQYKIQCNNTLCGNRDWLAWRMRLRACA